MGYLIHLIEYSFTDRFENCYLDYCILILLYRWVPPSFLVPIKEAENRSPQEKFREEVIHIDNKKQEAQMKRRSVRGHGLMRSMKCIVLYV